MRTNEETKQNTGYYAVQVRCRGEVSLATALRHRGFNVLLPRIAKHRLRPRAIKNSFSALFPGYLFVEAAPQHLAQLVVAKGVNYIVKTGDQLQPLAEAEVDSIRRLCEDSNGCEPCEFLTLGQKVRIESGPFSGLEGILVRDPERARVVLSLQSIASSVCIDLRDTRISVRSN